MTEERIKVNVTKIGDMLKTITKKFGIPGHEHDQLAKAISREFNVICEIRDVQNYEHSWAEDYELEQRKAAYDSQNRFNKVLGG